MERRRGSSPKSNSQSTLGIVTQNSVHPLELLKTARELRLVGILVDERYGRMGLGYLETDRVLENSGGWIVG